MNAQLKLTSTNTSGKSMTKTISDISPTATSAQYKALAQGLNSLTTNTYGRTDLVTTINVDTESTNKPAPTITIGEWTKVNGVYSADVTCDSDGAITASAGDANYAGIYVECYIKTTDAQSLAKKVFVTVGEIGHTYNVAITATETNNYDYKTVTKQLVWEG